MAMAENSIWRRRLNLLLTDIGRGMFLVTHSGLAMLGLAAAALVLALWWHPTWLHAAEQSVFNWLRERNVLVSWLPENVTERALAIDPALLPPDQAAVAHWLAAKYRVAPEPLAALVAHHRGLGAEATIALTPVDDPSAFGLVRTDAEHEAEMWRRLQVLAAEDIGLGDPNAIAVVRASGPRTAAAHRRRHLPAHRRGAAPRPRARRAPRGLGERSERPADRAQMRGRSARRAFRRTGDIPSSRRPRALLSFTATRTRMRSRNASAISLPLPPSGGG